MRIKSHWFRDGKPRTAEDIASATGFIIWRTALNAVKTMRQAGYEIPAGPTFFAVAVEFLVFLGLAADRIAHARGDDDWRLHFTTAVANQLALLLAENEAELLGRDSEAAIKERFIARFNAAAAEAAVLDWTAAGPGYDFLRWFAHRAADVLEERERSWAVSQLIDVEGPEAVATLRRGMDGLLGVTPRRRRAASAGSGSSTGE